MPDDTKKPAKATKADNEHVCPKCKSQNLSHDGDKAACPFCGWEGKKADCK